MEIFKYGLGYSCTSNLRAYSREIRTLARPHQQCHGRSFLKTESREPWIELLRSFFPRDGKAAIWDGRPPCEFLHTDAQKSDNISIIFLHKQPSGVWPNSFSRRVNSSAANLSQPQSLEISVNRAKVFLRHAKVGPNKTKVLHSRTIRVYETILDSVWQ